MTTTMTPTDSRAERDQLKDEHRSLMERVERLERTTDLHQLLPRLEKLKSQLEHHFAGEEDPEGLREDVTRNAPLPASRPAEDLRGASRFPGRHR